MRQNLRLVYISAVATLLVIGIVQILHGQQQYHLHKIRRYDGKIHRGYESVSNDDDTDKFCAQLKVSRSGVENFNDLNIVSEEVECPVPIDRSLSSYIQDRSERLKTFIFGNDSYREKSDISKFQLDFRYMADTQSNQSEELVIVMAASSNHFESIASTAAQVRRLDAKQRIIFYDIGLEHDEADQVQSWCGVEYRPFEFESYPRWMDVRKSDIGEYAWKPMILYEVSRQYNNFLWLDGDILLTRDLEVVKQQLRSQGFASSITAGTVRRWTHPGTLCYLLKYRQKFNIKSNVSAHTLELILPMDNANGATNAFNLTNARARQLCIRLDKQVYVYPTHFIFTRYPSSILQQQLVGCASEKLCIAPSGSWRENHRQDQAVLTVLAHLYGMKLLDMDSLGLLPHRSNPFTPEELKDILIKKCEIAITQDVRQFKITNAIVQSL
ncbi:hypothetical protein MIR68_006948 [Amoeboaphelidium protococcarum]|nr:hypothetical protein MIR68_006948 [Amoeboaphelidium protococcarum]